MVVGYGLGCGSFHQHPFPTKHEVRLPWLFRIVVSTSTCSSTSIESVTHGSKGHLPRSLK